MEDVKKREIGTKSIDRDSENGSRVQSIPAFKLKSVSCLKGGGGNNDKF